MELKIKFNEELDWNICRYAYMGCEEAKDPKYFDQHCINNSQGCPIKSYELLNKLKIDSDSY